jgi:hypothetical protein
LISGHPSHPKSWERISSSGVSLLISRNITVVRGTWTLGRTLDCSSFKVNVGWSLSAATTREREGERAARAGSVTRTERGMNICGFMYETKKPWSARRYARER